MQLSKRTKIVFGFTFGLMMIIGILYWLLFIFPINANKICIQVLQQARNPITREIRTFSTPCNVPIGWQKMP